MQFDLLVHTIQNTHEHFRHQAIRAVNVSLTVRNWLIGYYIVEFEQNGEDRAKYGSRLIESLEEKLSHIGISSKNLHNARAFFITYPEFRSLINSRIPQGLPILKSPTSKLQNKENEPVIILKSVTAESHPDQKYFEKLIERVSFTHFVELIKIDDSTKRRFFELLILKTTPSVRELKRQINTLAYERTGLSTATDQAFEQLTSKIEPEKIEDAIKSVYLFDFLGIRNNSLIQENDLEQALLDHLQEFILELGNGFCFEARQKRILIDDTYYFADLIFYHRILKCHVIIDLKVDAFDHSYLSQLNTYVSYYNAEIKRSDDLPAVGILLCTDKSKQLVEYATAGMDNQLFVSKYLIQLPSKEMLADFINKEMEKLK